MTPSERRKIDLAIERFVEAMTSWNRSPLTIESYVGDLHAFFRWVESETDVTSLGGIAADVISAYAAALGSMEKADGKLYAAGRRAHRLVAVKAFFRWLTREAMLLANPALGVVLPKIPRPLPTGMPSAEETIRMLDSIDISDVLGLRDRAILEVLYSTGMRNAELRGLELNDFDPENATMTIRGGKGGKDRVVPMGEVACEVVSDYIAHARPKLIGAKSGPTLFLSKKRRQMTRKTLASLVARRGRAAGIRTPVRPHKLRHACATHMLRGGADIRHIQTLLGHEQLSTTQIYTRVDVKDLKRVHRKFHPRERGR